MILKNGKRIDGCTDTLPVGTVQPFLGLTPPLGYLVCQGQLVSKLEYPELYNICKSIFGTETETHFYLPDLRGKTIAGYDSSDSSMNSIGKLLGTKTHTHTSAAHTHTIAEHTHSTGNHTLTIGEMPNHNHNITIKASYGGASNTSEEHYDIGPKWGTEWGNRSWLNFSDYVGGGQAHNHGNTGSTSLTSNSTTPNNTGSNSNFQPTITMNWIVKAAMLIPEYFIVENTLTSTNTSNALSAAQGKILDNKIAELRNAQNIIGSSYKYTLTASGEQPAWGWYPIGNEYTTGIIPAGRYIIRYGATVNSVATIITFNPYLDGGRTSTATRTTIAGPGSEGLLVSGQNIIWREFTTDATHTINTYVYTNGATTASAIEVEFIRIG